MDEDSSFWNQDMVYYPAKERVDVLERLVQAAENVVGYELSLKEAREDLAGAIQAAIDFGWGQSEIAKALGWDRRRVHAIVRERSGGSR
jgi:hypothetical protein